MTELAKFIFEQHNGAMILNKKQVAKLIGKSVQFIDIAVSRNDLEKIPAFAKTKTGAVEFMIEDVAEFVASKQQIKITSSRKIA